jgi:hypothetical protein
LYYKSLLNLLGNIASLNAFNRVISALDLAQMKKAYIRMGRSYPKMTSAKQVALDKKTHYFTSEHAQPTR